ncbi:STAS domain-containing protein [Geomicrobium sp. JSM 1781026]|uniref:STAS domain-containing protein n=1 Tax=Geomicrobium sp. JSM 1781026 TaxID=3344580 RepID=UPI0035C0F80F
MMDRNSLLYGRFFEQLQSVVERIVAKTAQSTSSALSKDEQELHSHLLYRLLQKVKKELVVQESTEDVNLDYDPTDVLAKQGHDLEYIVELLSRFRVHALEEIERELKQSFGEIDDQNQTEHIFPFIFRMTEIFDQVIANSTKYYNSQHKLRLLKLEEELLEVSAPIVPVREHISVLPVIGVMSEDRATHILNEVIPTVASKEVQILIVDFSGIHMFDTFAASRFFTITQTLALLGIRPVITGVRPEMAQTTIQLGVKLSDLEVYRDVKTALEALK